MTQSHDEDRLRDEFRRLRAETEQGGSVPDFATMMAKAKADAAARPELAVVRGGRADDRGAPRRRRALVVGGWVSAVAAAALAGVLLTGGPSDADAEFEQLVASYSSDFASGAWRSPTSALMDVPGMSLTRSVPSLGGALRGLDPNTPRNTPEPEGRDS